MDVRYVATQLLKARCGYDLSMTEVPSTTEVQSTKEGTVNDGWVVQMWNIPVGSKGHLCERVWRIVVNYEPQQRHVKLSK